MPLTLEQAEIERRMRDFRFDDVPDPVLPFAKRLAREQRWSSEFTAQVLLEYQRFLILAVTTPKPLEPCRLVDLAWQKHLQYTKSYWDRLCPEVLGHNLHREPPPELAEQLQRYKRTLFVYEDAFGKPPDEIWGHGWWWRFWRGDTLR